MVIKNLRVTFAHDSFSSFRVTITKKHDRESAEDGATLDLADDEKQRANGSNAAQNEQTPTPRDDTRQKRGLGGTSGSRDETRHKTRPRGLGGILTKDRKIVKDGTTDARGAKIARMNIYEFTKSRSQASATKVIYLPPEANIGSEVPAGPGPRQDLQGVAHHKSLVFS
ncbi:hypothetical protein PSPO01_09213 [Paraphaeosphaeria sporulosa]